MMIWKMTLAAGLLAATGTVGEQIKASDPEGIMTFLQEEGVDVTLTTDDYDDPKLRMEYDNHKFSLYFYGCTDNTNCQSFQFYSGYQTEGSWSNAQANAWNMDRRYGKAYISSKGSARIEYDVHTGDHGIHPDDFTEMFQTWLRIKLRFEREIDW